jgi:Uma2 family endonuclease
MSRTGNVSMVEQLDRQMRPPRWTPAMFRAACNAGCFDDMKVELIGGRLVEMTDNPPHTRCAVHCEKALQGLLPETEWFVVRGIFVGFPGWTPSPDVTVCRGPLEPTYADRRPTATDVVLIVEVSDSTYLKDRKKKLPRYARASIPTCWIVNLESSRVEVYSQPVGRRYRKREDYGEADEVPVIIDGVPFGTIPVRDILRKRKGGGE